MGLEASDRERAFVRPGDRCSFARCLMKVTREGVPEGTLGSLDRREAPSDARIRSLATEAITIENRKVLVNFACQLPPGPE